MRVVAVGLVLGIAVAGCRSADEPVGPYTLPSETARDTAKAERLNREAADLLATDTARAEELLRQALTADLFYGPAHNNLGVVYLGQQKLYEAANEFEWAKKLMPGHPDPRVNLGLVMEAAGRNDEAMASYDAALEVWPGYLPAIQGAASLAMRSGRRDDPRLDEWLDEVALRGDGGWQEWAQGHRLAKSAQHYEVSRTRQQISAQPIAISDSWMSARRSKRTRRRRNWWNHEIVLSTTQRWTPSPLPCPSPRFEILGRMLRRLSSSRWARES